MAGRGLRLRLRDFVIPELEETGVELGRGAYGSVVEMLLQGEKVAVKKIHQALLASDGGENLLGQLESECDR